MPLSLILAKFAGILPPFGIFRPPVPMSVAPSLFARPIAIESKVAAMLQVKRGGQGSRALRW